MSLRTLDGEELYWSRPRRRLLIILHEECERFGVDVGTELDLLGERIRLVKEDCRSAGDRWCYFRWEPAAGKDGE